jgi:4-nitrophenyl phosphatase
VAPNLVCDLDGVVFRGRQPVPGSGAALTAIDRAGWRVLFCTNNSSVAPAAVADKVRSVAGYDCAEEQVVTSAEAAARMLSVDKPPTFVLGGSGVYLALERAGVPLVDSGREAAAVVVGLATALTYDWLREAATAVREGARLIATNHDPTYPAEDGLWPGAGAIVAAVETASGGTAEYAGKPFLPMRDLLRERLAPGPVWVVGDRPDTDLSLTIDEPDWSSALVLSGVTASTDPVSPPPDLVAADLAAVVTRLLDQARRRPSG